MTECQIEYNKDTLFCSFCGKSQKDVLKLIASPTAYICDECIRLCGEIIEDDESRQEVKQEETLIQKIDNTIEDLKKIKFEMLCKLQ